MSAMFCNNTPSVEYRNGFCAVKGCSQEATTRKSFSWKPVRDSVVAIESIAWSWVPLCDSHKDGLGGAG